MRHQDFCSDRNVSEVVELSFLPVELNDTINHVVFSVVFGDNILKQIISFKHHCIHPDEVRSFEVVLCIWLTHIFLFLRLCVCHSPAFLACR